MTIIQKKFLHIKRKIVFKISSKYDIKMSAMFIIYRYERKF